MAYQLSTTIASNDALINAICLFAAANGWTVDRNGLVGANRTATLHKAGVTDYIHLYNTDDALVRSRVSVGYNASVAPSAQPNVSPADGITNALVGPYPSVWFFADGDEIDVVIRRADIQGAYAHIVFGKIQKYGSYNGGTYADGSFFNVGASSSNTGTWGTTDDHGTFGWGRANCGYMRVDSDGVENRFFPIFSSSNAPDGKVISGVGPIAAANMYSANQTYSTSLEAHIINTADDNIFSGRSVFQNIEFSVRRDGTPAYFSPIGYVKNRRYASLAKFDPEQEVTVGGEVWMMFPVARKAAGSSVNGAPIGTDNNGFAIKKVV